jgi:hypothetical protein
MRRHGFLAARREIVDQRPPAGVYRVAVGALVDVEGIGDGDEFEGSILEEGTVHATGAGVDANPQEDDIHLALQVLKG